MCDGYHKNRRHEATGVLLVTTDEANLHGYLHSIDPESGIHVLLTDCEVHLVPATTVKSIESKQVPENVPTELKRRASPLLGIEKDKLLAGLKARHIDVECCNADVRIFGGIATVQPPYGMECVKCTNESVLMRVRKVIQEISFECKGG